MPLLLISLLCQMIASRKEVDWLLIRFRMPAYFHADDADAEFRAMIVR